jgi:hypothetical protein
MQWRALWARRASSRKRSRRQPTEEAPGQTAAIVENDARRDDLAIWKHSSHIARVRRHCEERSDEAIQLFAEAKTGLLRRKRSSQ